MALKRYGVLRHERCGGELKKDEDGAGIWTCDRCAGVVDIGEVGDRQTTLLSYERGFGRGRANLAATA